MPRLKIFPESPNQVPSLAVMMRQILDKIIDQRIIGCLPMKIKSAITPQTNAFHFIYELSILQLAVNLEASDVALVLQIESKE